MANAREREGIRSFRREEKEKRVLLHDFFVFIQNSKSPVTNSRTGTCSILHGNYMQGGGNHFYQLLNN